MNGFQIGELVEVVDGIGMLCGISKMNGVTFFDVKLPNVDRPLAYYVGIDMIKHASAA